MKRESICLTLILIAGAWTVAKGQDSAYINRELSSLFSNGIRLENLAVTIPWDMTEKDLRKYGTPKFKRNSKRVFNFLWDSVRILDGANIDLRFFSITQKFDTCEQGQQRWILLSGRVSTTDGERLRRYFELYSGETGTSGQKRTCRKFFWKLDGKTGFVLIFGSEGKNKCYMEIRKRVQ
jgi:hypothetical protein